MMKIIILTLILMMTNLSADYRRDVKMPSVPFQIKVDRGFPAMQRNCQWCHSLGYVLNQGKQSKEYWRKIVVRMRDTFKAPITKEDEVTVTEYLYRNYGK
jgi:hypothetical protein